jgi:peptidoglycan-N-acetylglucosamine deacetylase
VQLRLSPSPYGLALAKFSLQALVFSYPTPNIMKWGEQIMEKAKSERWVSVLMSIIGILSLIGVLLNYGLDAPTPVSAEQSFHQSDTIEKKPTMTVSTDEQPKSTVSQQNEMPKAEAKAEPNTEPKGDISPDNPSVPVGKLISDIPRSEKVVYLTFDDGPSKYTKQIVTILRENQIKGSFFWVGSNLRDIDFAKEMIRDGEVIGTHTMNHTSLKNKSLDEQVRLIMESTKYISEKLNYPITYFRPPYGAVDQNTYKASIKTGQILTFWEVDSEDWRYPKNPEKVMANIMSEAKPGAIILLHEKLLTVNLLQRIIDSLRTQGYQFAALPMPKEKM